MASVNLIVIAIVWGASVFGGRSFLSKYRKWLLISIILLEFFVLFYLTREQFFLWHRNYPGKFLLPPFNGIGYFIFYSFTRFWAPYLLSLLAGLFFLGLAGYFNKRCQGKFFRQEEPYFLSIALFLSGHPGWIVYLILLIITILLFSLGHVLFTKKIVRLSYYHFWLPLAAAAIVLNSFLAGFDWYGRLIL